MRPDFVFPKSRTAIFVDGCFWHGRPKHGTKPKGNAAFWKKKFARNLARDRLVNRTLRRAGWRVLRIWEHELAKIKKPAAVFQLGVFLKMDAVHEHGRSIAQRFSQAIAWSAA